MKNELAPRLTIIDALSAGLAQARRRPWLILIPAILDLLLWLAPRVSLEPLLRNLMQTWDLLVHTTYTPDQVAILEPMLRQWHDRADLIGAQANLADGITGGWLGAPSIVANGQITRLSFVSDLLLGPIKLAASPWRSAPIQVSSFGHLFLALLGFWLIGQVIVACYLRLASTASTTSVAGAATNGAASTAPRHNLPGLVARLAVFSIVIGIVLAVLETLLSIALLMVNASSSSPLSVVALMFAGVILWLTLWFLLAVFFANEAILLEGQPILRGIWLSIRLVNGNLAGALGLMAAVNLLMYGFRVIWELIGGVHPALAVVVMLANAYLATSMLLATFAFYGSLRQAAVTTQAKATN